MEKKYEVINNYLNDYLNFFDDSFFSENLKMFYFVASDVTNVLSNLIDKNSQMKISLDGYSSLMLVKEFLEKINPEYHKLFDEYFQNGILNIINREESDNKNRRSYAGKIDNHLDVNVCLNYNYDDPRKIVHEFFHILNINKENGYLTSETRELLTEGISIYFEVYMNKFLKEKNFDKEELNKINRNRLNDTYKISKNLCQILRILYAFDKLGPLNETTYDLKESYIDVIMWNTKEEYEHDIDEYSKYISSNRQTKLNPFQIISYTIGTLLAYRLIVDDKNLTKMMFLNDNVLNMTMYDVIKLFNINLMTADGYNDLFYGLIDIINKLNQETFDNKKKK